MGCLGGRIGPTESIDGLQQTRVRSAARQKKGLTILTALTLNPMEHS